MRQHQVPPRATPKRPRRASATPVVELDSDQPAAKPKREQPVTASRSPARQPPVKRSPPVTESAPRSIPRDDTYERELELQKVSEAVDLDEFREFQDYLTKFAHRPRMLAAKGMQSREALLGATANASIMTELRQRVALFAGKGVIRFINQQALSEVIRVLEARVSEGAAQCDGVPDAKEALRSTVFDASLGVAASLTILAILTTPGSPRQLLVEEVLENIVSLLRIICINILYPSCDPLWSKPKNTPREKKQNARAAKATSTTPVLDEDYNTPSSPQKTSKRGLNSKGEVLLESCCSLYDALAVLFQKERHLPDAMITQAAALCAQCLPVTGVVRLQLHAMKTLGAIFGSYTHHRLSILDDVREAASVVPPNRRHLRCFQLADGLSNVRVTSALMAQLLCLASTDVEDPPITDREGKQGEDLRWAALRRKRHDRAVKLTGHVLEPLLNRSYTDREPEYRAAFQTFFEDILTLYGLPEWPAAELMLQTISVSLITRMRSADSKTVFLKSFCIDVLGALAARMCRLYGNEVLHTSSKPSPFLSESLEAEREHILLFLDPKRGLSTSAAFFFYEALFVTDDQSLAMNLRGTSRQKDDDNSTVDGKCDEEVLDEGDASDEQVLLTVQKSALRRIQLVATRRSRNLQVTRKQALHAASLIGINRSFARGFKTILHAILDGTQDMAPTVRAKSIKALAVVEESCEGLLRVFPDILTSIELRSRDASTLTRDAALELLSRSLSVGQGAILTRGEQSSADIACASDLFARVFPIVEKRLSDMSTSVRKRAISIMRSVMTGTLRISNAQRQSEVKAIGSGNDSKIHEQRITKICVDLVSRLEDPEATVRDAAERTLHLGLFGSDVSQWPKGEYPQGGEPAAVLAERIVSVYAQLPINIHASLLSRIVGEAKLVEYKRFLAAIVDAVVDQFHEYESQLASATAGKVQARLSDEVREATRVLSARRVACSSVICAFGTFEPSLVAPHCRALAPSIKGVRDGALSSGSEVACVQRILKTLEVGLGHSDELDAAFLEEVLFDVEVIMCQCPVALLEEASVRCLCAVVKKAGTPEAMKVLIRAANLFIDFLASSEEELRAYCAEPLLPKESILERNSRVGLVRLGLLSRYGDFDPDFISKIYRILTSIAKAVCVPNRRNTLARASIRALSHLVIRNRSLLSDGTRELLTALDACSAPGEGVCNVVHFDAISPSELKASSEGVLLSVLQWFQELLRHEEQRNSSRKKGTAGKDVSTSRGKYNSGANEKDKDPSEGAEQKKSFLAAEEDAEAGHLALCAQSMIPRLITAVHSPAVQVRRTVANVLGLLVRQGLVLPATVVPSLFSLLLDQDKTCRDLAFRVVNFLADRYSGMLVSAALPALRSCFESSFLARYSFRPVLDTEVDKRGEGRTASVDADETKVVTRDTDHDASEHERRVVTVEDIIGMSVDAKTGQSLLSQALMAIPRDLRRGVLENLIREFDPRISTTVECATENSSETEIPDDTKENAGHLLPNVVNVDAPNGNQVNDDDDVGNVSGMQLDISYSTKLCPIPVLYFLATTLASVDYTNGAGVGGSLTQGGGTSAADTKLKYAKEDVTKLIGIATRIISNSGQAVLRVAKQVMSQKQPMTDRKKKTILFAARMSLLLQLKHHLKTVRWKPVLQVDEGNKEELDIGASASRMPDFLPYGTALELSSNGLSGSRSERAEQLGEEQLLIFAKLMRDDAIDENDLTPIGRRASRIGASGGRRNAYRTGASKNSGQKASLQSTPVPKRQAPKRRSASRPRKRLRYDEGSDDDGGSDYDPTI